MRSYNDISFQISNPWKMHGSPFFTFPIQCSTQISNNHRQQKFKHNLSQISKFQNLANNSIQSIRRHDFKEKYMFYILGESPPLTISHELNNCSSLNSSLYLIVSYSITWLIGSESNIGSFWGLWGLTQGLYHSLQGLPFFVLFIHMHQIEKLHAATCRDWFLVLVSICRTK